MYIFKLRYVAIIFTFLSMCNKPHQIDLKVSHNTGSINTFSARKIILTTSLDSFLQKSRVRYEKENELKINDHVHGMGAYLKRLQSGGFTAMEGKRDPKGVDSLIYSKLASLRYAYCKRLKDKTGLSGWVGFKFMIDKNGKVINCSILESTMNDLPLQDTLVQHILKWHFSPIDINDTSKVYFPFWCGG